VSGNVSLHNQTGAEAIPPSPIVMCAGVVADVARGVPAGVRSAGDFLVMVGERRETLTGSAYLREVIGGDSGAPPPLDLEHEARLQELAVAAAEEGWVRAAHDVSDGGLLAAVAEMALAAPDGSGLGIDMDLGTLDGPAAVVLFSEQPAIVFEVAPQRAIRLFQAARERRLEAWPLGAVSAHPVVRVLSGEGRAVEWTVEELREAAAAPLRRLWNEEVRG
jgi:phosphoribosylformylglycinamidine synthase